MMTSDARKREAEQHHTHPDPAVRDLIEQAEARGRAEGEAEAHVDQRLGEIVRIAERAEAAEARADAMEAAVLEAAVCDLYDAPQNCITAGPEVFAADGCTPCRIRAALSDSTALDRTLVRALAKAYDDGYNDAATMARCYGHTDHWPAEDEPRNPYRADALGAGGES